MSAEKPGVLEMYGVAVNARSLELEDGRATALDRVADMGYARIKMSAAANDDEQRIAGELAPLLWRSAYGDDRHAALVMACSMFAAWLMLKPYFAEINRVDPGIAHRFAQCAINEWLSMRCVGCGGSGWEEIARNGQRVRPTGRTRNAPKAICGKCHGSGRRKESPYLRLRVLSAPDRKILLKEYEQLWRRQFIFARRWLKEIKEAPRDHLRPNIKAV